ncbi:MAG TPA: hypothetical protein VGK76_00685 [Candidatus Eisenbacteria bacterium]|jgi:hypothetical protein
MKKILAVTLVLVFTSALLFALGCTKKAEQGTEGEQGMEQSTTPPAGTMTDSTGMMSDTTHTMGH